MPSPSVPEIHIASDGTLTIDGKVVTPAEADTAITDVHNAWLKLSNRKNWSIKNAEKVLLYGVGVVGATNGLTFLSMSASLRETLVGASGFVLALIHVSMPTKAA